MNKCLFAVCLWSAALCGAMEYTNSYSSLKRYECPEWFRDAKFGIWSHWGPQSVPKHSGWYARQMYLEGVLDFSRTGDAHKYHQETYGHQSEFGYKDLIPFFTAETWEPEKLMKLYKRAGARYFVSMGQHHDNFDMWNSKLQPWNSVNMGPKRDIVKEWQDAAKKEGLYFGVSFHGEAAWRFFESSRLSDSSGPMKGVPYDGWLTKEDGKGKWWEGYDPQDLYCRPHKATEPANIMWASGDEITEKGDPPDDAYLDKFIGRVNDVVDSYRPELLYFDSYHLPAGEERGLKLLSSFYNKSMQWHGGINQGVVQAKRLTPEEEDLFMLDYENTHAGQQREKPWQTDIGLDGWFYFDRETPRFMPTSDVVHTLIDIVSKNGNMLLNITQTADGEIQPYAYTFLEEMAEWMEINAEAIHGSRPWKIFGEGPSGIEGEKDKQHERIRYTPEDFRFTTKGDILYAFVMDYPEGGGEVLIKSLSEKRGLISGVVEKVGMLGVNSQLAWKMSPEGLVVELPETPPSKYACAIKIYR
ncbi:alpha-L-fucosidase [Pontiella agarivorans]|uniref:alpha-L-fucosidase n=1 Tax=Pontiella agarivorans TaxID=3038953 RepID=A0ABU5MWD7_9BACT|nr:alpha-L-fucosidase [Pontiella agarivorans]MDZ8118453.1 alpha-L-fucosidase [Pontiella agarivorans]